MNSKNPNSVLRINIGKNKDKKLIIEYKKKVKTGKFDVAVLSHSSIPGQY
jgi:hypothetical protein